MSKKDKIEENENELTNEGVNELENELNDEESIVDSQKSIDGVWG